MSLLSDSRFRHPDERLHVHVDLSPEQTIQVDSTIVSVYSAKRGTVESVVQDSVPYFQTLTVWGLCVLLAPPEPVLLYGVLRRVHSTEVRSNVFRTHSPRDEGWAPGSFPSPLPTPLNPLFLWPEMSGCCSWPYLG